MIDILLAAYNGAFCLPLQLRSLQAQTLADFRVLMHDDGSTDGTQAVLESFAREDSRFVFLYDAVRFGNPGRHFLYLLSRSTAPYIICCDQDDIWFDTKLAELSEALQKQEDGRPQAVCSNSFVWEAQADTCGGHATLYVPRTLSEIFFLNSGVQGCAVMFNAALRDKLRTLPADIVMHDHVIALAALTWGNYTYLPRHLMLYRRTAQAVTGHTDSTLGERRHRFFHRGGAPVVFPNHAAALRSFYETYKDDMPREARAQFEDFFLFAHQGRIARMLHALRGGYTLFGRRSYLLAKILFRPFS